MARPAPKRRPPVGTAFGTTGTQAAAFVVGTPNTCCFLEADGLTRCQRPAKYMLEIRGNPTDAMACVYHYTGYDPRVDLIT